MTGIVVVELRFGEQVAAEALKNISKPLFSAEVATAALVPDYYCHGKSNLSRQEGPQESLHEMRSH